MPSYWSYLKRRVRHTFRYGREAVDIPSTIVGVALPALQSFFPHYWLSAGGQLLINTLFWQVPVGALAAVLTARFLAAPYQMHKEDVANAIAERFALERRSATLQERLVAYETAPITVALRDTEGSSLIRAIVTNRGDQEQRTLGLCLSMLPSWAGEPIEHNCLLRSKERFLLFPHVMPPRSSFELTFAESVDNMLDFGVASFHAVLELEDGRRVMSEVTDVSRRQQQEFPLPMGLEESIQRFERITTFVDAYTVLYETIKPTTHVDLALLAKAGITKLENDDELRQACDMLLSRNMHHAINRIYFDTGAKILDFFKVKVAANEDLSGANGLIELLYWRKDETKPFTGVEIHFDQSV